MENKLESEKNINNIFNYINTRKTRRKKNIKPDTFRITELEEIGISNNIANLLIKKKITKEDKSLIDIYLKDKINISYDLDSFDYRTFLCILNFYLYGFENSLSYFRNINLFIKKDILIKLTLYKNILDSCSYEIIKMDIKNIKNFIDSLMTKKDESDELNLMDNISSFSYNSEIAKSMELLEREKNILQIENKDLQNKYNKLKKEIDIKYSKILDENKKLKKQIEDLEKKNKLFSSKIMDFIKNKKISRISIFNKEFKV